MSKSKKHPDILDPPQLKKEAVMLDIIEREKISTILLFTLQLRQRLSRKEENAIRDFLNEMVVFDDAAMQGFILSR
jgi:hypothetical protein